MPIHVSIEQEELRGISRTVAEIHWLLLILILLYLMFGGVAKENEPAISSSLFFYAALVMAFRYANFFRTESRWKIAIETWAMIAVITWALWFTGRLHSPLLNAYLLVVITAALTLGKLTTMFSADIRYVLQRAKLLSELDELTALYNTRGFAIAADRLFGQALRYARPASMLMIDLDNLKSVNDSHGHEAGNRLLRHTANAMRAELRYTDLPARYGGDEFIVLLPETPPRGALDVAERIRKAVAEKPLDMDAGKIASSVSIGVACFPEDGRTLDALATRADRALYEAKQKGRNCVVRYRAD